jgi:hypothetical protein
MDTQINLLRKGSLGIKGTERNADHHAKAVIPYIEVLKAAVPHMGFKEWKQGHNVHVLITRDDRVFVLRPIWEDGLGYTGVKLLARVSRTHEIPLIGVTRISRLAHLVGAMEMIAKPVPKKDSGDPAMLEQ